MRATQIQRSWITDMKTTCCSARALSVGQNTVPLATDPAPATSRAVRRGEEF